MITCVPQGKTPPEGTPGVETDNGKDYREEYRDEWKASVEISQKFDEMLFDLRKYGFTIIAASNYRRFIFGIFFYSTGSFYIC